MKEFSKSEDWLALLLWGLDLAIHPSPRKFLRSFEWWDYQNRIKPQLWRLQRAKLLERRGHADNQALHLTPQGRLKANGGIDAVARWERAWDGKWRMLIFDLPVGSQPLRLKLWRWLRSQRFGFLQRSVWISPDRLKEVPLPLARAKLTANVFTVIEGRPTVPDSDDTIVGSAWDFEGINQAYQSVLDLAASGLDLATASEQKQPHAVRQWLAAERAAWIEAVSLDPLLPESLLPTGYLGRDAWTRRRATYMALAEAGIKNSRK